MNFMIDFVGAGLIEFPAGLEWVKLICCLLAASIKTINLINLISISFNLQFNFDSLAEMNKIN